MEKILKIMILKTLIRKLKNLEFLDVDKKKFPAIRLKPILDKYISLPIILNAANEIFVDQFLKKYKFLLNNQLSFHSFKRPKIKKICYKKTR